MARPRPSEPRSSAHLLCNALLLNEVDPLVARLVLLGQLSPLVDEAPMEDKARVAIGLLEISLESAERLEAVLTLFTHRLPRCEEGQR
jgi:hypothetical protein